MKTNNSEIIVLEISAVFSENNRCKMISFDMPAMKATTTVKTSVKGKISVISTSGEY